MEKCASKDEDVNCTSSRLRAFLCGVDDCAKDKDRDNFAKVI